MALKTWRGGKAQNRNTLKNSGGKFRSQGAQINLPGKEDLTYSAGDGGGVPETFHGLWHPSGLVSNHSTHLLTL